jgi:hypothetical protein
VTGVIVMVIEPPLTHCAYTPVVTWLTSTGTVSVCGEVKATAAACLEGALTAVGTLSNRRPAVDGPTRRKARMKIWETRADPGRPVVTRSDH